VPGEVPAPQGHSVACRRKCLSLRFEGFATGATFTQQDATHWVLTYNGGIFTEVITFQNAATIDATDFQFL
jgi:hypothetical protein